LEVVLRGARTGGKKGESSGMLFKKNGINPSHSGLEFKEKTAGEEPGATVRSNGVGKASLKLWMWKNSLRKGSGAKMRREKNLKGQPDEKT